MRAMVDPYTRERLEGWVSDFCAGDGLVGRPSRLREAAPAVLLQWLVAACERGDRDPDELTADDLGGALVEHVARLDLGERVHARVPDLCRDFLAELEAAGRLGDGRDLGLSVAARRPAYERAARGEVEPLTRPGAKIGRNDPCPCGSGEKYKRCCARKG